MPEEVRSELTFHPVATLDEVLAIALDPAVARRGRAREPDRGAARAAAQQLIYRQS